ncbi:hypothetical protein [Inquilinus sp. CA228]|uniref:hypothetical protein n=1 Tax=Inquilinus sp. CA228 TaxID=3455609 RepID=UPI003F8D5ECD
MTMPPADRIAMTVDLLRRALREEADAVLTGDDRVDRDTAARLLRVAPQTLDQWRKLGQGPAHYARGWDKGRVSYRLHDIAQYIEQGRFENGQPDRIGMNPE